MHNLQEKRVVLIAQDSFYRGLTPEEHANVTHYNFDHPDAIDVVGLYKLNPVDPQRLKAPWFQPLTLSV